MKTIKSATLIGFAALFVAIHLLPAQTTNPAAATPTDDSLTAAFVHPPDLAKPRVMWFWVQGNISKEGITADLEAMQRVGLGGAELFSVDQSKIVGPIAFKSPEWLEMIKHTLQEAARLNLEIAILNCNGWSESGGPWVPSAESMQKVTWSIKRVTGGQKIALDVPQPPTIQNTYQDIALFAYPTPTVIQSLAKPLKVTSNGAGFNAEELLALKPTLLTYENLREEQWVQYEYAEPVTFRSVSLDLAGERGVSKWQVQASDDGATFRPVTEISSGGRVGFSPISARFFRVCRAGGSAKDIRLRIELGGALLSKFETRIGMVTSPEANRFVSVDVPPDELIAPASIINLTGQKEWQAPAGEYTLLRIGATSTGVKTRSSTKSGLEVDKFSAAAVNNHLQNMYGQILKDSPNLAGKPFHYICADSWEVRNQNWTPEMAKQFKERRGYDPVPWLPTLSGLIIGSAEETQRFLWDLRRTQADLLAEMHYGTFQKFAHANGLEFMAEAPGIANQASIIADTLLCKKYTDVPMGEFWVGKSEEHHMFDIKEAASAAHIYGKKLASSESFTALPQQSMWKNDPYSLKALGDQAFCQGINQLYFHRYTHQPWLDRIPGMCMGPWGINFDRTNTWWEPGKAWMEYLARCQALLQAGRYTADLCYYYGEDAPAQVNEDLLTPLPPQGYGYDVCNTDVLVNLMEVKNNQFVLPGGMSYRLLVLPNSDRMTLSTLRKIETLVQAGGTVYGPKPAHTPSLSGYPQAELELNKIADKMWGDCDGKTKTENPYGKGKIIWGAPLEQVLAVPPDFIASKEGFLFIHRQVDGAEVYFVSNQNAAELTADCAFRVTGMQPELWYPDTGKWEILAQYKQNDQTTTMPIRFDPSGSAFVVFRKKAPAEIPVTSLKIDGKPLDDGSELPVMEGNKVRFIAQKPGIYELTTGNGQTRKVEVKTLPDPIKISGPWKVTFPPKLGAPDSAVFDKLISWTDSPVKGIKYFSGTATYTIDFTLPLDFTGEGRCCALDLGMVKNLAEVTLNGKNLGVLWKAPFRMNITEAMQPGINHLEIKITNLWPNRLIGDQSLKEDERITWTSVSLFKASDALLLSGLIGPVTIVPMQIISFSSEIGL
jgi:hypothetical protein